MIHLFPIFSADPENTPLGSALRDVGVAHRLFGTRIRFHYRRRILILLVGYPRLAWFGLRSAWRSLVLSRPRPDAVVLWSDVEVLLFAAMRRLTWGSPPAIVLMGFIYTERASAAISRLRHFYFGIVLRCCDRIVCHSRLEIARYARLFPAVADRFVFVPWGGHVNGHEVPVPADETPHALRVLAAGRSGRDYATLARAVAGLPLELTIICDNRESLAGVEEGPGLRLLRACYEDDYLAALRAADVVAVPLAVDDISAGQMVMIQAMALAKPVLMTCTPTVLEYMEDGAEGLLVPRGDAAAWRAALLRLHDDPALRRRLGAAGRATYLARYGQHAYVRHLLEAIVATS